MRKTPDVFAYIVCLYCTLLSGCGKNQKVNIYREAILGNWRLSERDSTDFEHYASYFLSDAPVTDGHYCLFSRLADLTYGSQNFDSGPVCNEQGASLYHFPEREAEADEFFKSLTPILDKRHEVLDQCYVKFLEEHPDSCFYWSFHHRKFLSGPMIDAIFRHVAAQRPRSKEFARYVLVDLFGDDSATCSFAHLDSGNTEVIPFDAMYDFWQTNGEYVLSYRADPFMVVETNDTERFRDVKVPSPMTLVLSSNANTNTVGRPRGKILESFSPSK